MRAEELFEAIGELDEQLIALSEEDGQRARAAIDHQNEKQKAKRKKRAEIYRFVVVTMTTAAAVFLVLMAWDFLGPRNRNNSQSAAVAEQETMTSALASGAPAMEDAKDIETPYADSASEEDAAAKAAAEKEAQEAVELPQEYAMAESAEAEEDMEEAAEAAEEEFAGMTAVDLLGNLKGDYVKLEFISAEDAANGGERSEPEYTKEREEALSSALQYGEKRAAMFTDEGAPVYYVFLTKRNGKVDTVTFYEKGYVSIDTVPGVVLKLSDESFAAVMETFS